MSVHRLPACRPEPLGSYLKALGVLRLVGEQADPLATAWWRQEALELASALDQEELIDFFRDRYHPSPLVAPWNGGSGFAPEDKKALEAIALIEATDGDRLAAYRSAIRLGREVVERAIAAGWDKKKDKSAWIEACRATFPDEAVSWIDAAVVITAGKISFPPLLGSGGNDGRLDFSATFMHRLADALCLRSGRSAPDRARSMAWLAAALFGTSEVPLAASPVGQFDPGGAGGVNSSPFGAAESLVNPWDFVLMLEGTLLFAGAVARRMGATTAGKATMPFMVDASQVGYASSAAGEASPRGELWGPLWDHPATAAEVAYLIAEGRAEWKGRQAKNGIDAVRAARSLGVDRGIDVFVRHALVERLGLSTLAVPVGRVSVRQSPDSALLGDFDSWISRAKLSRLPPTSLVAALRRVDQSLFEATTSGGPPRLQSLLITIAEAEASAGRAADRFRAENRIGPVACVAAAEWLPHLDDGSPEFRIAAGLASLRDDDGSCLRFLLCPIRRQDKGRGLEWTDAPSLVSGFGFRPLVEVLAQAHVRRALEATSKEGLTEPEMVGIQTAFRWSVPVPIADAAAFVDGELDDERVGTLMSGLMLLDWKQRPDVGSWHAEGEPLGRPPQPAWALIAPFYRPDVVPEGRSHDDGPALLPEGSWPGLLARGQVQQVLESALRRLRIARLDPTLLSVDAVTASAPAGVRLGAALLLPISRRARAFLLRRIVPPSMEPRNTEEGMS